MSVLRFRSSQAVAVKLPEACRRLGFSIRTGERLLAEGRFPVPELPRLGPRTHHRFSSADIDAYLATASTADVHAAQR